MDSQQAPNHQLPPEQSPLPAVHNPLAAMQPGEQIICEVKRHPIGLLGIYVAAGIILILLAVGAFVILPGVVSAADQKQAMAVTTVMFLLLTVLIVVFVFIANIVYWGNRWVVTSDSITQMHQTSLFSKQSAQLSLGNLEDVTTEQNGIFPHIFNFGTIKAETAGERSKFMLTFCPNPDYYAQKILAAREVFERDHHGGKQEPYQAPPANPFSAQPAPAATEQLPRSPADTPQYQVGQTPPDFGAQATAPPPSPFPQPPATNPLGAPQHPQGLTDSQPAQPGARPETSQPLSGINPNTPVD